MSHFMVDSAMMYDPNPAKPRGKIIAGARLPIVRSPLATPSYNVLAEANSPNGDLVISLNPLLPSLTVDPTRLAFARYEVDYGVDGFQVTTLGILTRRGYSFTVPGTWARVRGAYQTRGDAVLAGASTMDVGAAISPNVGNPRTVPRSIGEITVPAGTAPAFALPVELDDFAGLRSVSISFTTPALQTITASAAGFWFLNVSAGTNLWQWEKYSTDSLAMPDEVPVPPNARAIMFFNRNAYDLTYRVVGITYY